MMNVTLSIKTNASFIFILHLKNLTSLVALQLAQNLFGLSHLNIIKESNVKPTF